MEWCVCPLMKIEGIAIYKPFRRAKCAESQRLHVNADLAYYLVALTKRLHCSALLSHLQDSITSPTWVPQRTVVGFTNIVARRACCTLEQTWECPDSDNAAFPSQQCQLLGMEKRPRMLFAPEAERTSWAALFSSESLLCTLLISRNNSQRVPCVSHPVKHHLNVIQGPSFFAVPKLPKSYI